MAGLLSKIVLTGAAGDLGGQLRQPLAKLCKNLVSTDRHEVSNLAANETFVQADLADLDAMCAIIDGAEMVVHFGAIPDEDTFENLLGPNFIGAYNVWEAAHRGGARRVVYASSIHAVGMYPKTQAIGTDVPHRPDTFYGLSKCFAEDLGRMYFEKRGLETVCIRICSATKVPGNSRALGSWLSPADLVQIVTKAIDTPIVDFTVVYGVSNNDRAPVDNANARFLGYRPTDNAESYADDLFAQERPIAADELAHNRHGGGFAAVPLGESGVAFMTANTAMLGQNGRGES